MVAAAEGREEEVTGVGIDERALGAGEAGDEVAPGGDDGVSIGVEVVHADGAGGVLRDDHGGLAEQGGAQRDVRESFRAAGERRGLGDAGDIKGAEAVGRERRVIELAAAPGAELHSSGAGVRGGDEVDRRVRLGHAKRGEIDDLVGVRAAGEVLGELVGRPAGGEEHAAGAVDDAAIVVWSGRVHGACAGEAVDVAQRIAGDADCVQGAAGLIRGASQEEHVERAREHGEAAEVGRHVGSAAEVGKGVRTGEEWIDCLRTGGADAKPNSERGS